MDQWRRRLAALLKGVVIRRRAAISYPFRLAVLLVLFVPMMVEEIPFPVAVAFVLAAAAVLYLVERWEDPVRARNSWGF